MKKKYRIRELKAEIKKILLSDTMPSAEDLTQRFDAGQLVSPLISFFCSTDKTLKWRAISIFTEVVDSIAQRNIEKAKIIMRRLMWTLNEESGGVGWGAPEAMGELMRLNPTLAGDYHNILFSYIDDHGNFLDYEPLQQGVLWGIYRLAQKRPELAEKALPFTKPYYSSENPVNRYLALQISKITNDNQSGQEIAKLTSDDTVVEIYEDGIFNQLSISRLANDMPAQYKQANKEDYKNGNY